MGQGALRARPAAQVEPLRLRREEAPERAVAAKERRRVPSAATVARAQAVRAPGAPLPALAEPAPREGLALVDRLALLDRVAPIARVPRVPRVPTAGPTAARTRSSAMAPASRSATPRMVAIRPCAVTRHVPTFRVRRWCAEQASASSDRAAPGARIVAASACRSRPPPMVAALRLVTRRAVRARGPAGPWPVTAAPASSALAHRTTRSVAIGA